ncbi:MAG: MFS transporter [Pseudomonadota bacterium]
MHPAEQRRTIAILAFTQIMSWGALYYAIAILAPDIGRETGWRSEVVVGAFSWSLLVSGLAATPVGVLLDRHGGRWVMASGSLLCGLGLILLSRTQTVGAYFAAWTLLGLAMAMTMYEAAFATLNRAFGMRSRQAISTLTLFGGFASTVFWPLTQYLDGVTGWRDAYLAYGIAHIALCMPLHLLLGDSAAPRIAASPGGELLQEPRSHTLQEALRHPAFWKLAFAFSANSFIFSALSVHLIPLLRQYGHAAALAVWLSALVGPMQVAGRIGEMTIGRKALPQTVGKLTFGALPAALLVLLLCGAQAWAAALFCMLYGMSNGILTIVRGTIPQTLFGRKHYGAISGALAGPALLSRAAGPLAVAAIVHASGTPATLLSLLLAVALLSLGFYLMAVRSVLHT